MRRLRHALSLGVVAVAAAALVQGAAAAAPTAITGSVSAVGGTSATVNGTVNPGGAATDWWFEYGTSTSYGSKTATTAAGSGSANVSVSKALTGLSPATTYHYRLVAKNATATTNGGDGLFTTASPPVVVTSPATGVGPTTATLGGTVNPNGEPTTWYVEYGTSTSYGTKTATTDAGSGSDVESGLGRRQRPGRREDLPLPPRRDELGGDGAGCRRDVRHRRAARGHDVRRELDRHDEREAERQGRPERPRDDLRLRVRHDDVLRDEDAVSASAGSGARATNVSLGVSGLKSGTTYHFRLVATSDAGTRNGADQTFTTTTSAPTVVTGQASAVGPTSATLGGSVNPERALDDVVRRVRDEHLVRLADLVAKRRLGDGDRGGRGDVVEAEGRASPITSASSRRTRSGRPAAPMRPSRRRAGRRS